MTIAAKVSSVLNDCVSTGCSRNVFSTVFFRYTIFFSYTIWKSANIFPCLIVPRRSRFIVPSIWAIVVRRNLTNFEGCYFARFYILIWWSFLKIETKNFNSGPYFFKLVKLGPISPTVQLCSHWKKSDNSSIHLWFFFLKTLHKIKKSFSRFLNYKRREKV